MGIIPNVSLRRSMRGKKHPQQLEVGSRHSRSGSQQLGTNPTRLRLRMRLRSPTSDTVQEPQISIVGGSDTSQGATLDRRIKCHLQEILGDGPETGGVSKLLSNRPTSRTITRKATQLASFDEFMSGHNLLYPATGTHLACWIGELYENRLRGIGPSVSAASLPGYLSGVRTSLVALGHPRLPVLSEWFARREVFNAYRTWEASWSAEHGKIANIRIAVPAEVIQRMMNTVLSGGRTAYLRDLAIVVLSRVHGLRANSVQSIERSDFCMLPNGWTVVVTVLKGHTCEQARRYGARRFVAPPVYANGDSCMNVMSRWLETRPDNDKLLFGAGCSLDESLRRLLRLLKVNTPKGCFYSSHSIRSAAFTESCLLGEVNMSVLIMQYNWVSLSMPKIYFDHRLTLTPSVKLFASATLTINTEDGIG